MSFEARQKCFFYKKIMCQSIQIYTRPILPFDQRLSLSVIEKYRSLSENDSDVLTSGLDML